MQKIPTDQFSSWLEHTRRVQSKLEDAIVPCGSCTACCTSSYFIHIEPDETETLSKIPKELQFTAPGLAKGNIVLGYDKNGHCPMFMDNKCSIYENRPRTCRKYDCRVFPATGLSVSEEKKLISEQADRWDFKFLDKNDQKQNTAVKTAAKFINDSPECFPIGFIPRNRTQQAVLAIKVYKVFLTPNNSRQKSEIVEAILQEYKKFENDGDK